VQGKLAYLAPEQIQRGVCDRRGDVFALGVVLHELLTGERLFRRDSDAATIEAIVREPIPDPRERRGGVPDRLAATAMRALERDPARRFPSADELRLALEGVMAERAWLPTSARLGCWLTHLFGDADARQALSPPAMPVETTGTNTDAAAGPALVAPVGGVTAVRLFAEARRRGTRQLVRVVGEGPAALMKAGQELVAVPLHVVQSAQRFTRGRIAGAALGLSLIGFGLGLGLREAREALSVAAVEPPVEPPAQPDLASPRAPPEADLQALVEAGAPPQRPAAVQAAPPATKRRGQRAARARPVLLALGQARARGARHRALPGAQGRAGAVLPRPAARQLLGHPGLAQRDAAQLDRHRPRRADDAAERLLAVRRRPRSSLLRPDPAPLGRRRRPERAQPGEQLLGAAATWTKERCSALTKPWEAAASRNPRRSGSSRPRRAAPGLLVQADCAQVTISQNSSSVPMPPGSATKASESSAISALRSCIVRTSRSSVTRGGPAP
jgi:hypothetical protein